jgi:mannose-6-phosphate isomerase-like protein (cupin superfamily)
MIRSSYTNVEAYVTKDGSEIRELMHPARHGNRAQSLAEATVARSMKTALHRHDRTEEIYHITQGTGRMTLGSETFEISAGVTVCIPPGAAHCVENTGVLPLKILCACAPAYTHDDTVLL